MPLSTTCTPYRARRLTEVAIDAHAHETQETLFLLHAARAARPASTNGAYTRAHVRSCVPTCAPRASEFLDRTGALHGLARI